DNTANLLTVFDSLNFEPHAEFIFKPGYIGKSIPNELAHQHTYGLFSEITHLIDRHDINLDERYLGHLTGYSVEQRHDIYEAMIEVSRFEPSRKAVTLAIDFITGQFYVGPHYTSSRLAKALLTLLSAGLMRLMDIRLSKKGFGPMSLKRASS